MAPISFESAHSAIVRRIRGNMVISACASEIYTSPPSCPDGLYRKEEVMLSCFRGGHSKHLAAYHGRVRDWTRYAHDVGWRRRIWAISSRDVKLQRDAGH